MRGIQTFMAARSLARSLDDGQRALIAALVAHPDAEALLAEVAGESRRFRRFGHDGLDDAEVMLVSSLDYALAHYDPGCDKLRNRIVEDWDDLSTEVRSRIVERVELALLRDAEGVTRATADWRALADMPVDPAPAYR